MSDEELKEISEPTVTILKLIEEDFERFTMELVPIQDDLLYEYPPYFYSDWQPSSHVVMDKKLNQSSLLCVSYNHTGKHARTIETRIDKINSCFAEGDWSWMGEKEIYAVLKTFEKVEENREIQKRELAELEVQKKKDLAREVTKQLYLSEYKTC